MTQPTRVYPIFVIALLVATPNSHAQQMPPQEGDYITHNFHFKSGETLPELRLHYRTLGKPAHDASGRVTNAVLILHGTTGSGRRRFGKSKADQPHSPSQKRFLLTL